MLWNKNISYRNCINCYIILKKYVTIYLVINLQNTITFTFHNDNNIPNNIIYKINNELLNRYRDKNICDYFVDYPDILNCNINIYFLSKSNLDNYILSLNNSYKNSIPKWVTGITTNDGVYLVPNVHNIPETITLILHESIHYLSKQIPINTDSKRYNILEEALSTYISSQMTTGKFSKIVEDLNDNNLKTITYFLENDDNDIFAKNNGYYYSFFFMKFLKNKYYKQKIFEYIIDNQKLFSDLPKLEKEFKEFLIDQINFYTNKK